MREMLDKTLKISAKTNAKGQMTIEQKQSRALRAEIMAKIAETLKAEFDVDFVDTKEGLFMLIPNEDEGSIPVVISAKMTALDTDIDTLAEEKAQSDAEKAEKAEKKAKEAEARAAKASK